MLWLLLPAGIFAADEMIKNKAESWNEGEPERKILKGRILLCRLHNRGAALNFMEQRQKTLCVCTAGMTAALAAAYGWLIPQKGMRLLKTGVGMMLGGAASNAWDRLRKHYVVDYFRFQVRWKRLQRVVFNLSDMCIFLGAGAILLWDALWKS